MTHNVQPPGLPSLAPLSLSSSVLLLSLLPSHLKALQDNHHLWYKEGGWDEVTLGRVMAAPALPACSGAGHSVPRLLGEASPVWFGWFSP